MLILNGHKRLIDCSMYVEEGKKYLKLVYMVDVNIDGETKEMLLTIPKVDMISGIELNSSIEEGKSHTLSPNSRIYFTMRQLVGDIKLNLKADSSGSLYHFTEVVN